MQDGRERGADAFHLGLRHHAGQCLAEARLLHARDDVLKAIRGEDRRLHGFDFAGRQRPAAGFDEVVRIGG
jgi:hypothetical protein